MAELIFRTMEDADIPAVNDFYNNYHHANRTAAKFRWEFEECPHGKAIYCLALIAGSGQIIGIQAGIPMLLKTSGGEEKLTIKSEDTLVDVDLCASLKIKYLFRDLYAFFVSRCREQGVVCIWGFTWAKKSLKRIGFQIPFDAGQGLLVMHPLKSYRNISALNAENTLGDKLKIAALVATSWVLGLKGRWNSSMAGLTMREGVRSNEDIFTEIAGQNPGLVFVKQDESFLKWRLELNPYPLQYSMLNFSVKNHPAAQVVTSLHPNGQGYLEQLLTDPELPREACRKIVRKAVNHLRRQGAVHVRMLTFDGNELNRQQASLIQSTGFFLLKKGMGFVFLELNASSSPSAEQFLLSRLYTQGHQ